MDSERLRSALLGSKLRIAGTVLGALVVSLVAAAALGLVGVPSVESVDNRFGDVDENTTVVVTDVTVDNPNPVGTGWLDASLDYTVSMNDVRMAEGSKDDLAVGPGRSTVTLETRLDNRRIPDWWVTHVRNGERTTVAIDAEVGAAGQTVPVQKTRTINTSMIARFDSNETRAVDANARVVDDPVLYVNETRGEWGTVTESETPMNAAFVVYNPKPYPYAVTELRYEITMNDVVVGEGTTEQHHVVEPGTAERITARTAIRNDRLDEWWVTHLRNDQVTELRIEFAATVELEDPTSITGDSVEIRVPMEALTHEETIRTDVLGSKNGTENGTDGEAAVEPTGTVAGASSSR